MTKIDFKTQNSRTTKFHTGFNNINVSLGNFEIGLETRRWGESEEGEHIITFEIEGIPYRIPLKDFIKKIKPILKRYHA